MQRPLAQCAVHLVRSSLGDQIIRPQWLEGRIDLPIGPFLLDGLYVSHSSASQPPDNVVTDLKSASLTQ